MFSQFTEGVIRVADSFLSTNELAERWNLSAKTLERWRQCGTGPAFLKFGKAVRYRIEDVIEYERCSLKIPAAPNRAQLDAGKSTAEACEPAPRLTVRDVVAKLGVVAR